MSLEILALNMERGVRLDAWVSFLETCRPDILLASELDIGCDRSGKLDVPAELARRMGMHFVFAQEFQELTQGGSHGNAIFSRHPIRWAKTVTLPREYDWFFDVQKRTGDRCALLAQLDVGGKALGVGSIHLENRTGPEGRVRQLKTVLAEAERLFPPLPHRPGGRPEHQRLRRAGQGPDPKAFRRSFSPPGISGAGFPTGALPEPGNGIRLPYSSGERRHNPPQRNPRQSAPDPAAGLAAGKRRQRHRQRHPVHKSRQPDPFRPRRGKGKDNVMYGPPSPPLLPGRRGAERQRILDLPPICRAVRKHFYTHFGVVR